GVADTSRRCLHFLSNINTGKTYYCTPGGEYYRMMEFIPDSVTHEKMSKELARAAGVAFGDFQKIVAPLAEELHDTIPHFHDMEFRLSQLDEAIAADKLGRVAECKDLLDFIDELRDEATLPERLFREGKLPLRVCHCDTKVNNILFDKEGDILCVIDLDTVMPSLIFSDYGDFLRTGANAAPEDEPNLAKVAVDKEVYDSFTDGYLQSATFLTKEERELLPKAMFRFAYMQGVRFLTDYLNGDTYFKIQYPEHNLVRTRAQLRLAELSLPH
ncbi:MAG: aminoglycoside phosphotransferase family protein, partial [Bacteroidales bacterium]|nr:aminoglycoside phosphotransferase family protein [Bacteroidales bacterium]